MKSVERENNANKNNLKKMIGRQSLHIEHKQFVIPASKSFLISETIIK